MGKPPKKQLATKTVPAAGGRRAGWNPFWLVLILVAFVIVSLPTVMILGLGMLPTVVAFLVDRQRPQYAALCVGGLNLAGVFPHLLPIWFGAHTMNAAQAALSNVFVMVSMYGAAVFGWMLYFAVRPMVGAVLSVMAQRRVALLRLSQKALIEEWGESVANPHATEPAAPVADAAPQPEEAPQAAS